MINQRMILLVGSPRQKGTSFSFARTIKILAEEQGFQVELEFVYPYYEGIKPFSDIQALISVCNTVGMVMPMYIDTLPAPVIWFMEEITRTMKKQLAGKKLFAVAQCGFPDVYLLQPSLESCRLFARSNGMVWLGGVGYGGGAIIDGRFLENLGRKGGNIIKAFRMMVEDIAEGHIIHRRVQQILTVKIPRFLYGFIAAYLNHRIRKVAVKFGVTLNGSVDK